MALYRCGSGGDSSTPITPSNSSPVALTANTSVKPTTNGYAIATYSDITPSNSSPVSLTSGEIDKIGGNGYAIASYSTVTPTGNPTSVSRGDIIKIDDGFDDVIVDRSMMNAIKGSNTMPEWLYGGSLAKIWGNDPTVVTGYAIKSYTPVTPSSTPTSISAGDMVQVNGSGVIVDTVPPTPTNITPSNSSPVALTANTAVKPTASGYAIASYNSVTPSNSSPVALTSGDIDKMGGNGYAIASYSSITPSNSSPVSLSSGSFYKMGGSGYAIASYSSKTPSDTSPASVSSGAIIKASSSGYLVKNTPVSIGVPDVVSQANLSGNSSRTIAVTKTPRAVIFLMVRNSDSTGRSYGWCYDVQNSKYEYFNYTADGYSHTESTSALSIIAVTSSSVTVTNNTAATCRSHVLIYY